MPSPITLPTNATGHLEDAAAGINRNKLESLISTESQSVKTDVPENKPQVAPQQPQMTVALSFAYDIQTKSLNIIMTDQNSGEVVRKISYQKLPSDVHQSEKLNGLLLDRFA